MYCLNTSLFYVFTDFTNSISSAAVVSTYIIELVFVIMNSE